MTKQITNLEDIKLLINSFYDKVRQDELLAPVFNEVIGNHWTEHLEKMYRFWQTVLLNERTYQGSPFQPHLILSIEKRHFNRWIKLFSETVNEHFEGEKADEAKWRAQKMAEMFQHKLSFFRDNSAKPIQ